MKKFLLSAVAVAAMSAGAAQAATISFSNAYPVGFPPATTSTNWSTSLSVSKFNPLLGTLTGVGIKFAGTVDGTAKAESLDASASTVVLTLGSNITLDLNPTLTLADIVLALSNSNSHSLTAFDGVIDFAGTSGVTDSTITASGFSSLSTSNAADLAFFTGLGAVSFGADAKGASTTTGPGNIVNQFSTNAGAEVTVTYEYRPTVVPEPASIALLGLGLAGLAVARRRKA